ncbi:peptidylprolyl isomerase [Streptomyces sp. YS-3]|uniref:peptidylprolyl isomerase n=1 Tax=Streptomyces sp. YS-3 TaxID=3381352 RepID=UPI0038629846
MTERTATLHISQGAIRPTLFADKAPKPVSNFGELADVSTRYGQNARGTDSGPFFDASIFHRVIPGFAIQDGDPTGTGRGAPGYKFADDIHPPTPRSSSPTVSPWPMRGRTPTAPSCSSPSPRPLT